MYLGMRIFELAKQIRTVRHYVWSSIDSYYKVSSPYRRVSMQIRLISIDLIGRRVQRQVSW